MPENFHDKNYDNDTSGWVRGAPNGQSPTGNNGTATRLPNFDKGNAYRTARHSGMADQIKDRRVDHNRHHTEFELRHNAGMTHAPEDYNFLANNPDMVEAHQLTALAAHEAAQQGHQRGTDGHREATRRIFNQRLGHMRGVNPEPEPPELELDVPKPPPPPPRPDPGALYSAPVSHQVANGSGRRQLSPSQVHLSFEQRQAARAAGITETEYARQLQKLPEYKRQRGVEHE
jgi:hypothetical protein